MIPEVRYIWKFERARRLWEAECAKYPTDADKLTECGRGMMHLCEYGYCKSAVKRTAKGAVAPLEKAVELNPRNAEAFWLLGDAHTAAAFSTYSIRAAGVEFDKALECFKKADQLCPGNETYMDSLRLSAEHDRDTHKKFRNGSTLYWTARAILNGFRPICDDVEGAKRECEAKESNGQVSQQTNRGGSAASSSASASAIQFQKENDGVDQVSQQKLGGGSSSALEHQPDAKNTNVGLDQVSQQINGGGSAAPSSAIQDEPEANVGLDQVSQQINGGGSAASSSAIQHEPVWLKVMHKAAELYQVTNGANTVSKRELEWHEMEHKNGGLYQLANGAYPAAKREMVQQNGGCDHVSQPAHFGTSAEWEMVQQNCGCDAFATAELERQFYESLQRLDGCDHVSNFGEFGFASAEGSAKKKKSDSSSEVFGLVTFAVLLGASIAIAKFHVRYMA